MKIIPSSNNIDFEDYSGNTRKEGYGSDLGERSGYGRSYIPYRVDCGGNVGAGKLNGAGYGSYQGWG